MEGERSMATSSMHLRTLYEPLEMRYFGKIVGYGENTILAEYDPDDTGEVQTATFIEVPKSEAEGYPGFWKTVFTGEANSILELQTEAPTPVRAREPDITVRSKRE
jgi:hypothetical protein